MKRFILITLLALTLTSCVTTEKCKGQDNIEWFGVSQPSGYGGLYNWYAATDVRGFVSGWHVPTQTEYNTLITSAGGASVAGTHLKEGGTIHWLIENTGDNTSNFTAFAAGARRYTDGAFVSLYSNTRFWTSDEHSSTDGHFPYLAYNLATCVIYNDSKINGVSIRLLKDDSTDPGTVTIDGDVYTTVTIGTQVWLARNLKATHYANGDPITNVTDDATWAALTTEAFCWYNNDYTKR